MSTEDRIADPDDEAATPRSVPTPGVAPVVTADLAAESKAALAAYRRATDALLAAEEALEATFSLEQRRLWGGVDTRRNAQAAAFDRVRRAEVVRHFPGLAPAIRAVWEEHAGDRLDRLGACCDSDAD